MGSISEKQKESCCAGKVRLLFLRLRGQLSETNAFIKGEWFCSVPCSKTQILDRPAASEVTCLHWRACSHASRSVLAVACLLSSCIFIRLPCCPTDALRRTWGFRFSHCWDCNTNCTFILCGQGRCKVSHLKSITCPNPLTPHIVS